MITSYLSFFINFLLGKAPNKGSMPLLKMIRITALYFILAFSIIAGIFNLRIILNYNSLMPLIFILLFLFIEIFTLIYFIVKKNLLFAQKLAVAGILMMMTQTIIDGGGYYGLGIFYFIIIFSALHLFLNYKLSIFILIYFFIGITVRLLWGNFLPESIYNNEVLINRFILIFGMSSGIGLLSITINELLTKHLYTLAYTNPITEMPNRYKFMQFLDESISGSTKNIGFSLIGFKILDFNRFIANLGNKNGDIIITEVSNKIKSVIPTDSFIAHWSNSIFLIIIRSVSDNKIRKINNSFFQCLQNPFIVDNGEAYLQAISAISKYPDDSNTPDKIIENVLALLDNNKIKPGKTFFYSKLYKEQEEKRLKLVYLLNNVNMDRDFHLVYQPKIRLSDKKCIGAEVLLRWDSHESGLISPAIFIPLAEEIGLIQMITKWVITKSFKDIQCINSLRNSSDIQLVHAVNLSISNLRNSNLSYYLEEQLRITGCTPDQIELEITETQIMDDSSQIKENLKKIRDIGFSLAIDDFGTGYSSLSKLHMLNVHNLKIDKSFVDMIDIDKNNPNSAVIEAIISLAISLKLTITAEGVETLQQSDFLESHGCHIVQGWYYSKELVLEDYIKYLEKN